MCTNQGGILKVSKGILVVMKEKRIENVYHLEGRIELNQVVVEYEYESDYVRLWNQRLGHMSKRGMKVLVDCKSLLRLNFLNLNFSKYCFFGKQCRQKYKIGRHIRKGILDYIHSYVSFPPPTISFGGSSYFVTFIDDYSIKVWIYILKRKFDVFNTFKQFRALVEKSTGSSIRCLIMDNGGEFTSMEFENYCKESHIEGHKTTIYTPHQNGVVEHMNKNILERERFMLSNSKLQQ
jgi:transposase InsO family protein